MKKEDVKDFNSALHYLSKRFGVIVWDTIGGVFVLWLVLSSITTGIINFRVVVALFVLVVLILGGHFIGTFLWKTKRFDEKAIKYSRKVYKINDKDEFIKEVNKDIQAGDLLVLRMIIVTPNYIIGRVSDVFFAPIIIPRNMICKYEYRHYKQMGAHLGQTRYVGYLACHLCSNTTLECAICGGLDAEKTIQELYAYGIPMEMKQT